MSDAGAPENAEPEETPTAVEPAVEPEVPAPPVPDEQRDPILAEL